MELKDLGNLVSAIKGLSLSDEQKETVKNVVKTAAGNKKVIIDELKKRGINISEGQVDAVIAMVDKL